jgi:hypothetical protein
MAECAAAGEPREAECTKMDRYKASEAFNQLEVCTDVDFDELKRALIAGQQSGGGLGGLNLDDVNQCLTELKEGEKPDPECVEALRQLASKVSRVSFLRSS